MSYVFSLEVSREGSKGAVVRLVAFLDLLDLNLLRSSFSAGGIVRGLSASQRLFADLEVSGLPSSSLAGTSSK